MDPIYLNWEMFFPPGDSTKFPKCDDHKQLPKGYLDEEPQYSSQINKVRRISKNQSVNLVYFLSRKGKGKKLLTPSGTLVPIKEQLREHYVLVCCFFLPMAKCLAKYCLSILYLCEEMSAQGKPFKVVVVPKIRPRWKPEAGHVFNHFFSAFKKYNCIAVSPRHSDLCDFICKSLGLTRGYTKALLLVSPRGEVLQTEIFFLNDYGAASYLFTPERLHDLGKDDERLKIMMHRLSTYDDDNYVMDHLLKSVGGMKALQKLRDRHPSAFHLLECDYLCAIGGGKRTYSYDTDNKLVGVYLCLNGGFMDKLITLQRQCREKGLDLVIVLVSLAFYDYLSHSVMLIKDALQKHTSSLIG